MQRKEVIALDWRHEWKIEISPMDLLVLRSRLSAVMKPDIHAKNGKYFIRSLYFDTPEDKALREKTDGVNKREKFRLRYYNGDTSLIHLEKKSKLDGLCHKSLTEISTVQAQRIVNHDISWMADSADALVRELYTKMRSENLRPKTIVDYTREPFVFPAGNVRVTFDYDIRTGLACTDFLQSGCVTVPIPASPILMEVKWDAFLPDIIRDAVWLEGRRVTAFSKYAQCRAYG